MELEHSQYEDFFENEDYDDEEDFEAFCLRSQRNPHAISVHHTAAQTMEHFNELAYHYLGISADEFVDRYERGEYNHIDEYHDYENDMSELFFFRGLYPTKKDYERIKTEIAESTAKKALKAQTHN